MKQFIKKGLHLIKSYGVGFLIIVIFEKIGHSLHSYAHGPLPSGVLGLILLSVCLSLKIIKLQWVEKAAALLTKNMGLLFIPLLVGLSTFSHVLEKNGAILLVSMMVSLVLGLLVTGGLAHVFLSKLKKDQ